MLLSDWLMVIYCSDGSGGGMCQGTVNPVESAAVEFSSTQKGVERGGKWTCLVS